MITKQEAIKRACFMDLNIIRYYMGNPNAKYEACDKWVNNFLVWLANDYKENYDNFVFIVAEYNK